MESKRVQLQDFLAAPLILCRPLGGLNDSLNQIAKCVQYAEKHGRRVLIDFNPNPFVGVLFSHLVPRNPDLICHGTFSAEETDALNSRTAYPRPLMGRLFIYQSRRMPDAPRSVRFDRDSLVELTFDFSKSYSESILVHHSEGGGDRGLKALQHFWMADDAKLRLAQLRSQVPERFAFAHIRSSDYKTDSKAFFLRIRRRKETLPLYVATDNSAEVLYATELLAPREVFSLSESHSSSGRPLHRVLLDVYDELVEREAFRVWQEIYLLTQSESFYYTSIVAGNRFSAPKFSGFSLLLREFARSGKGLELFGGHRDSQELRPRVHYLDGFVKKTLHRLAPTRRLYKRAVKLLWAKTQQNRLSQRLSLNSLPRRRGEQAKP